jgi:hypothetical protein
MRHRHFEEVRTRSQTITALAGVPSQDAQVTLDTYGEFANSICGEIVEPLVD